MMKKVTFVLFLALFSEGNAQSMEMHCHSNQDAPRCTLNGRMIPMTSSELRQLAETWVTYWKADEDTPEREALFGINEREWELVADEPLSAWSLVLEILKIDSSNKIQEVLSAGPLEDLLVKHGPLIIGLVECEAKTNTKFAHLLGGVWKNSMSDEIWNRVQSVWDRRGWDGIPNK